MTALVIDDDPAALFVAKGVLNRVGAVKHIITARNGLEAIQVIQSATDEGLCPELVLIDINMPVMDGFGFVEAVRKLELPCTPILAMLTSSENPTDLEKAHSLHLDGYLPKPLKKKQLQEFLEGTLREE